MKRCLAVCAVCLAAATIAVPVRPEAGAVDDGFDNAQLLQLNADQLKSARVSAYLEAPIEKGTSVLWCASFQLAWDAACGLVGEDLHFAGREPETVGHLNRHTLAKGDLDQSSYVAVADFMRNNPHAAIRRELARKFGSGIAPRFLPPPELTPRPQDIIAYAFLLKHLEFEVPFERLDQPLAFGGVEVSAFGIGEEHKPGHAAMYPQVRVLDYGSRDDFVIELLTKSAHDRMILAKVAPQKTLLDTVRSVQKRAANDQRDIATAGDVLKVPRLNFDITRKYHELLDLKLQVANPEVAGDLQILSAVQNTRFQMDEKGVRLKSESHIAFGCGEQRLVRRNRDMIFDRPFLILLERANAKCPYFALWVDNAELLVRSR